MRVTVTTNTLVHDSAACGMRHEAEWERISSAIRLKPSVRLRFSLKKKSAVLSRKR